MKELKAIIRAYSHVDFEKQKAALATVVRVKGSAYRSPGSRMLILDNGQWTGSISGGCLEGDALRKARTVMQTNEPLLITYDTTKPENNELKINLGCNGIIDVFFEPVNPSLEDHPISLFNNLSSLFSGLVVS
jgi:xanthine/CO dehydrogenase XdhC/CoxF family maturation factor